MPPDYVNNILEKEKELAFLPPGHTDRLSKIQERDILFRELFFGRKLSNKISDEDAIWLGIGLLLLRSAQEERGRIISPLPNKELCEILIKKHEADIIIRYHQRMLEHWHDILNSVESERKLNHQARRFCLEQVIKNLEKLATGSSDPKIEEAIRCELARALFLRAKIIRRKGFTFPLKKIEKLRDALNRLEGIEYSESMKSDPVRLRAWICYETARAKADRDWMSSMNDTGWEALKAAVEKINLDEHPEDTALLLALAEKEPDFLKKNYNNFLETTKNHLDLAWAAWIRGDKSDAADNALKAAGRMPKAFSHEAWERLVRLIRVMEKDASLQAYWRELAGKAWTACRDRERETHHLHLRWYWSRQRELYDLAFRAETDLQKKAEIADSLKSRPALTLSQLEDRLTSDEKLYKFYEDEARGYLDQYIRGLSNEDFVSPPQQPITWQNPPRPWIVVHFYLENRKGEDQNHHTGHALIYNAETKQWAERIFRQVPLWQAYWSWQEAYRTHGTEGAPEKCAIPLENLCLAIGREMEFLFDQNLFPPEQPVLFVTHDFLHRIPIHMAMRGPSKNREVWLLPNHGDDAGRQFSYLPAWWLWRPIHLKNKIPSNQPLALINWSNQSTVESLKDIFDKCIIGASKQDLWNVAPPPSLLVIYCHGHSHPADPFKSYLDLAGKPTLLEILKSFNCNGSRIFLGACETDLTPPISSTVDEHISISFAFLQKGSPEILGTLWAVMENHPLEIIEDIEDRIRLSPEESISKILSTWVSEKLSTLYLRDTAKNRNWLFNVAAFRTLGLY